ncbi:MAG: response regulator transcription factor, partial [Bacteroidota bacterium]
MPKEIFLVEDDTSIGSLVEAVFIGNGSNVSWYTSGTDALKHFNYGKFDICIFDLSLPDTDGIRLSRDIREIDPKIPFLFITANQEMQLKYQAFEAGCDDYVIKPFQIRELVLRVDAILRRVSGGHVAMPEFTDFSFDPNSRIITTKDKS